jgi:hypothetical protein
LQATLEEKIQDFQSQFQVKHQPFAGMRTEMNQSLKDEYAKLFCFQRLSIK